MTQVRVNPTTGANGDAITAANTGSAFVVTTGGTGTVNTSEFIIGTRSWLLTSTTTSGALYFAKNGLSTTTINGDLYVKISAAPSAALPIAWGGTSSRMFSVEINANRTVNIKDAAGTVIWTSTYAIPLNTWVRVSWFFVQSATVGQARCAIYLGHSQTSQDDSTLLTGRNTGSAAYTDIRVGAKASTGTQTFTVYIGSWSYDPAATGLPLPYGLPIAAVSADMSGIDPGKIVTIDGGASDPVSGSITNWNWSLTGTPAGSLVGSGSSVTFLVPPSLTGATYTVTLVITNTSGNTSTASMTIAANPASRRVKIGGVIVPVFSRPKT